MPGKILTPADVRLCDHARLIVERQDNIIKTKYILTQSHISSGPASEVYAAERSRRMRWPSSCCSAVTISATSTAKIALDRNRQTGARETTLLRQQYLPRRDDPTSPWVPGKANLAPSTTNYTGAMKAAGRACCGNRSRQRHRRRTLRAIYYTATLIRRTVFDHRGGEREARPERRSR
jgi:hypothetical protein